MGILNVEDEHQATALTLSPCSNSCNSVVEMNQKGSDHGYEEEAPAERNKTKKTVRFEEASNQIIVFTSAAAPPPHASKKVVCICAPATHAGAFKCRLHRENSSHRPSSSAPWMVKHGGRGPKVFSPAGKVSQHGGFGSQTHHSKLVRAAMANVQQSSAGVDQTQIH
ncbi:uncharacterized protein LOC116014875 isoform X2 [Ipomoea triloba]|uniref:uncharacterized protein LOC116014875 isoform X2 n=1 Tax=Ipomoea triloba TaxID=35885 RepID=UPI00125E88DA|nr:uncharacterized protein LOC116014875 isoform X2 [Ipomoea triloba]